MRIPVDVKYFIEREKGIVIAKLDFMYFDITSFLDDHKTRQCDIINMNYVKVGDLTGKSVCSSLDKFDLKTGKKLAKTRLMRAFYRRIYKAMDKEITDMIIAQNEALAIQKQFLIKQQNAEYKLMRMLEELE